MLLPHNGLQWCLKLSKSTKTGSKTAKKILIRSWSLYVLWKNMISAHAIEYRPLIGWLILCSYKCILDRIIQGPAAGPWRDYKYSSCPNHNPPTKFVSHSVTRSCNSSLYNNVLLRGTGSAPLCKTSERPVVREFNPQPHDCIVQYACQTVAERISCRRIYITSGSASHIFL